MLTGTLRQARGLGAAGAILVLVSVVPSAGAFSIVGLILTLIAVKYIGELVKDRDIYSNMSIAVALSIIGAIVGFLVVFSAFSSLLNSNSTITTATNLWDVFIGRNEGLFLLGLVAVWILFLLSAVLVKKSYDSIALGLGEDLFSLTGKLFLIGAALTIVFGIGLILVFIAVVLQVAAFLSIPDEMIVTNKRTSDLSSALQK
ncbi:MAG TPA: DUF996 domain-containing protein [Candidatus Bathyarchaeia archaeon]|nr:DUF996 domain-containing protein [Candidatus Bathyarchaeia archaeon]